MARRSRAKVISTSKPDDYQLTRADLADPAVLLCCGFGSGLIRPAPGTWGSLLGVGLWWLLLAPWGWLVQSLAILALFALGTYACKRVLQKYGVHDPGAIVVDELVGVWIALFVVTPSLPLMLLAFGLFRFFDVIKPWPVSWADRSVPGALGVMLDDVLAGLLACLVLQVSLSTIPGLTALLS